MLLLTRSFKTFFQDIQGRLERHQILILDLSFGDPYAMASHGIHVCIWSWRRRLFILGISTSSNIYRDGRCSLHPLNISDIRRYRWFPLIVGVTLQTKSLLTADLSQVFYCRVLGCSLGNRNYWHASLPFCSPVMRLRPYGPTCSTRGYTKGLFQNHLRRA